MTVARPYTQHRINHPIAEADLPILHGLASGQNFEEIAREIGLRAGTVNMRIQRLRLWCKARTVAELMYRWGKGELA